MMYAYVRDRMNGGGETERWEHFERKVGS